VFLHYRPLDNVSPSDIKHTQELTVEKSISVVAVILPTIGLFFAGFAGWCKDLDSSINYTVEGFVLVQRDAISGY
jgi:hypothetical protein